MAKAKHAVPEGLHAVTPQLACDDAAKAIAWYIKALGAEEVSRAVGPDGKILHADIRIGNSRIFLNDAMMGAKSAKAYGGSPASLWLYVDDCDVLYNRAKAAGAKGIDGPMGQLQDQFWGDRSGSIIDPEGYMWTIATHKEDFTPQEMKQRQEAWMKGFAEKSGQSGAKPAQSAAKPGQSTAKPGQSAPTRDKADKARK